MRGCCGSEAWHRGGSGNSTKESGVSCFVFWRFSVLAFQSFVLVLVQGWVFLVVVWLDLSPAAKNIGVQMFC